MAKKYKIGLALSGGGMRGVAHLGVLRVMEELGLHPDIISGVSSGAIVGSLYADGQSIDQIKDFFLHASILKGVTLNMPKHGGLANTKGYKKYLETHLRAKTFEELRIPLIVNAAEIIYGQNEYFSSGNLVDAVVASASVPILFNPKRIDGKLYVDGGIFCNLPAEILRDDCELVIGVHVNPIVPLSKNTSPGLKNVAERVFHLAVNGNTIHEKSFCDLVIDMTKNKSVGMFENSKAEEIYKMGYDTALKAFEEFDFEKYGLPKLL
jgi:NTE family protein